MTESWRPVTLKVQGLAYEILGEYKQAIEAFEEALILDSNIGVKRKVAVLKKKLGI